MIEGIRQHPFIFGTLVMLLYAVMVVMAGRLFGSNGDDDDRQCDNPERD